MLRVSSWMPPPFFSSAKTCFFNAFCCCFLLCLFAFYVALRVSSWSPPPFFSSAKTGEGKQCHVHVRYVHWRYSRIRNILGQRTLFPRECKGDCIGQKFIQIKLKHLLRLCKVIEIINTPYLYQTHNHSI